MYLFAQVYPVNKWLMLNKTAFLLKRINQHEELCMGGRQIIFKLRQKEGNLIRAYSQALGTVNTTIWKKRKKSTDVLTNYGLNKLAKENITS